MRLALIGPSAPLRGGIAQYHDHWRRRSPRAGTRSAASPSGACTRASSSRGGRSTRRPRGRPRRTGARRCRRRCLSSTPSGRVPGGAPRRARPRARSPSSSGGIRSSRRPWRRSRRCSAAAACRRSSLCHNLEPHEPMPGAAILTRLALGRAAGFLVQSSTTQRSCAPATRGARSRSCCTPRRRLGRVRTPPRRPTRGSGASAAPRRSACLRRRGGCSSSATCARTRACRRCSRPCRRCRRDVQLVVAGEIYHHDAAITIARSSRVSASPTASCCSIGSWPPRKLACCFGMADVVVLPYWGASQSGVAPLAFATGARSSRAPSVASPT